MLANGDSGALNCVHTALGVVFPCPAGQEAAAPTGWVSIAGCDAGCVGLALGADGSRTLGAWNRNRHSFPMSKFSADERGRCDQYTRRCPTVRGAPRARRDTAKERATGIPRTTLAYSPPGPVR